MKNITQENRNAMTFQSTTVRHLAAVILIVVLTLIVYWPGLSGGFIFDDVSNITNNPAVRIQHLEWNALKQAASGLPGRPISRASFGLDYLLHGLNPFASKLENLLIHITNALLIYALCVTLVRVLKRNRRVLPEGFSATLFASAVALAWALHPINLTSVLYVVQRMNSLSTLFVLMGLLLYLYGRQQYVQHPLRGGTWMALAVILFTPLAYWSKENGVLLMGFIFLFECCLFRFQADSITARKGLKWIYALGFVVALSVGLYYISTHPGRFLQGYNNRFFTLEERLLTEPRIIWDYIRLILLPSPSGYGLFMDDVVLSRSLWSPWTTIPAVLALILLGLAGFWLRNRQPVIALGILLFLLGHSIESTFIPLELAFEHRNYFPSLGLLMVLFYVLLYPYPSERYRKLGRVVALLFLLLVAALTFLRAQDWSNNTRLIVAEVTAHPESPRANYEIGKRYAQVLERGISDTEKYFALAKGHLLKATTLREDITEGLFGLIMAALDAKQAVDPVWQTELARRLQTQPFRPVNVEWLKSYARCVEVKQCPRQTMEVLRLLDAADQNPSLGGGMRASLYSIRSRYEWKVEKNLGQAISDSEKSIRLKAGDAGRLAQHAYLLLLAGRIQQAGEVLNKAQAADRTGFYAEAINRIRQKITAAGG